MWSCYRGVNARLFTFSSPCSLPSFSSVSLSDLHTCYGSVIQVTSMDNINAETTKRWGESCDSSLRSCGDNEYCIELFVIFFLSSSFLLPFFFRSSFFLLAFFFLFLTFLLLLLYLCMSKKLEGRYAINRLIFSTHSRSVNLKRST